MTIWANLLQGMLTTGCWSLTFWIAWFEQQPYCMVVAPLSFPVFWFCLQSYMVSILSAWSVGVLSPLIRKDGLHDRIFTTFLCDHLMNCSHQPRRPNVWEKSIIHLLPWLRNIVMEQFGKAKAFWTSCLWYINVEKIFTCSLQAWHLS